MQDWKSPPECRGAGKNGQGDRRPPYVSTAQTSACHKPLRQRTLILWQTQSPDEEDWCHRTDAENPASLPTLTARKMNGRVRYAIQTSDKCSFRRELLFHQVDHIAYVF